MMLVFASAALLSTLIGIASIYLFVFAGRDELPRPLASFISAPAPISAVSPALPAVPVLTPAEPAPPEAAAITGNVLQQVSAGSSLAPGVATDAPAAVAGVTQGPIDEDEPVSPEKSGDHGRNKIDDGDDWAAAAFLAFVNSRNIEADADDGKATQEQRRVAAPAAPPAAAPGPAHNSPPAAKPGNAPPETNWKSDNTSSGGYKSSGNRSSNGNKGNYGNSGKAKKGNRSRR